MDEDSRALPTSPFRMDKSILAWSYIYKSIDKHELKGELRFVSIHFITNNGYVNRILIF